MGDVFFCCCHVNLSLELRVYLSISISISIKNIDCTVDMINIDRHLKFLVA